MKTIIIATDFSNASKNAADYAAQLSKIVSSKVVLFHGWSIPVLSAESLAIPISFDELQEQTIQTLNTEAERIKNTWGVSVEVCQKVGFASELIVNCAKENNAGLVILGMEHRNKAERILGSVATSVIHQSIFPSLLIPENVAYSKPINFLFATDLHSKADWKEFDLLAELAGHFHAGIHILNAVQGEHVADATESRLGIKLEGRLKDFPHFWHFPHDGDIVHAISKTAKEISADWIAIVPHKLSWMKQLFHHSISRELAFNSNYPVLALPERSLHMNN